MTNPPAGTAQFDYAGRQARLEELLSRHKLDALLVTYLPNIRYLCGFTGTAGVLLIGGGKRLFFPDGRYREQAGEEVRGAKIVLPSGNIAEAAAKAAGRMRLRALGIESDHMTVQARDRLKALLPRSIRLRRPSGVVEEIRMLKEPAEVEAIRAAVRLGSSLYEGALRHIRPGVAESRVSAELEYAARMRGAEGMSFETIVAAGNRSALPHGRASSQPIPASGFVVLDFGVILGGYCSDMTRTVHVGKVSARAREMYEAVREAQQAATEAVRPGVASHEVDSKARSVLRGAGLARFFTHSTGHGVGLEVHEPPRLGKGQREVLRPGMVVTIEPGIYMPGQGGVRIEDMVVVTGTGHEILTPTPKELTSL